jgi:hypothetical protein
MSSPVIFGQDVQLKCEFPSHIKCSSYTRSWTGGPRYALMTMNGISSNNTKYQETKFFNCTSCPKITDDDIRFHISSTIQL